MPGVPVVGVLAPCGCGRPAGTRPAGTARFPRARSRSCRRGPTAGCGRTSRPAFSGRSAYGAPRRNRTVPASTASTFSIVPSTERPGRRRLRVQDALDGEHDVLGGQGLAVVELDARTEVEGPRLPLVVGGPAGGQLRLGLELLVDPDQVVEDVLHDHVLVALDRQRGIQRARRAQPGLLDDPARPGRLGGRPPGERARGQRHRRRGRAQLQEPPAREMCPSKPPGSMRRPPWCLPPPMLIGPSAGPVRVHLGAGTRLTTR